MTPLGLATKHSLCDVMCALLRHGANADIRDNQGNTLLHVACREQADGGLDAAVELLLRSGADETAVNDDGRTPLELLELPAVDYRGCYPEEMKRARLLLSRAPADRAWSRRCWLVMLCSRASNAGGGSGHGLHAAGGRGRGGRSTIRRGQHAGGGANGLLRQTGIGRVIGAGGEGGGLKAVVKSLIELEPHVKGVFRTVVSFL